MYYNYSSKKEKDYQKFLSELAMANINYYSNPGMDILKWRGEGDLPTAMKSADMEDIVDKIIGNGEKDNDMVELDENFLLEDDDTPAFEDSAIDKKGDKEGGINLHIAPDVLDKVDGDIDINIEGEDDLNTDDILGKKDEMADMPKDKEEDKMNEPVGPMGVKDEKEKDEVSESYYSSRKSPLSLLEDKFENDILSALLTEMEALNEETEDEDDKKEKDEGKDFASKLDDTKAGKEDEEEEKKDKDEGPELDFSDIGKDHDEDIEDLEPTDEDLKATETDDDHDHDFGGSGEPVVDVDTSDGDIDINIKISGDDDMSDVDDESLGLGSDDTHDIF